MRIAAMGGAMLVAGVMVVLGAVVGLIVNAILFAALRRVAQHTGQAVEAAVYRHLRRPARLVMVLTGMLVALAASPLSEMWKGRWEHLTSLVLIAAFAWCLIQCTVVLADVMASRYSMDAADFADSIEARRIQTQVQVFRRIATVVVVILALATMLLTFPGARSVGASLLASAGLAGLVLGMAMRPTLSNIMAGIQIALSQPMRLEDAVIVENEFGRIEEITSTYVVVRLWDLRRMVLPLTYFIEKPFQNWTRNTTDLLGSVYLYVDYSVPVEAVRAELERIVRASDKWLGKVLALQVTDASAQTVQLRALVDAKDAGTAFDLRCLIREGLVSFLQREYPQALPKTRAEVQTLPAAAASAGGS